jgi:hypothetical protein
MYIRNIRLFSTILYLFIFVTVINGTCRGSGHFNKENPGEISKDTIQNETMPYPNITTDNDNNNSSMDSLSKGILKNPPLMIKNSIKNQSLFMINDTILDSNKESIQTTHSSSQSLQTPSSLKLFLYVFSIFTFINF